MKSFEVPPLKSLELVLDLIFPKLCQGCSLEGNYFCFNCQNRVKYPPDKCFVCGLPSLLGRTHEKCRTRKMPLDGLLVAAGYDNPGIRNLIWNLKYNYVKDIAVILAAVLADYFFSRNLYDYFADSLVIPVPLHRLRQRARGFNQAALLAQDFARRQYWEFRDTLERVSNSESQIDLPREKRFENVKGLFRAKTMRELKGKNILLVDDVATTGATLNECAKALKAADAAEIWGLVVARN